MQVKVLSEHGYNEAMLGMSLSYNSTVERAKIIAPTLAHRPGGGHGKFLESIYIWLDVTFPRYVWQEASTYRVGNSMQSESTMHTLMKKKLDGSEFETSPLMINLEFINTLINDYCEITDKERKNELMLEIKGQLPESFLQRRVWCLNYKNLQNIYWQRIDHRLPQWKEFLTTVLSQIEHPEFIVKPLTEK